MKKTIALLSLCIAFSTPAFAVNDSASLMAKTMALESLKTEMLRTCSYADGNSFENDIEIEKVSIQGLIVYAGKGADFDKTQPYGFENHRVVQVDYTGTAFARGSQRNFCRTMILIPADGNITDATAQFKSVLFQ